MQLTAFDTETTGLAPGAIIQLAAVKMTANGAPTDQIFSHYLNPNGFAIHPRAAAVHGKTAQTLAGKPLFRDVAREFLNFIGKSMLLAHNASFDRRFLNAELRRLHLPAIPEHRWIDSLQLARARWQGQSCGLDACCERLNINVGGTRETHSAVNDAILCAHIYHRLKRL